MKKLVLASMVFVTAVCIDRVVVPARAQSPAPSDTPTFYHLVPGTYVNGWPRFTITYPKDWVEKRLEFLISEVFSAAAPPSSPGSMLSVNVFSVWLPGFRSLPLEKFADGVVPIYRSVDKDLTVLGDKSTRLKDGTPAWEVETRMIDRNKPQNVLNVGTKKGDMWVNVGTASRSGKIEEFQRSMLYSVRYEPNKDVPVKVPPDVQEFLEKFCSDVVSHDLAKVMTHYSDRFLHSGTRKGEMERFWQNWVRFYTSSQVGAITDFVAEGDRAYLAGFLINNIGPRSINETSIIKENGEWKWYGNQRDVAP
jgi:hypothetical protein